MYKHSRLSALGHSEVNGEVWDNPSKIRISWDSGFQNGHHVECSGFEEIKHI
jgi:hypothetical protein